MLASVPKLNSEETTRPSGSSLLAKALRRSRRDDRRNSGGIHTASKLKATGGASLKVGSAKYSGQNNKQGSRKLYPWFSSQASALHLSQFSAPPPSSSSESCKGDWGETINIVTAYDRCDYTTEKEASKKDSGGTLSIIFNFYAKLQKPGVQRMKKSLTYTEIQDANSTLSYFETLCCLRDFDTGEKRRCLVMRKARELMQYIIIAEFFSADVIDLHFARENGVISNVDANS